MEQKITESWEELSLVSASPILIQREIEGVVINHVAKTTKQQKGTADTSLQSLSKVVLLYISKLYTFVFIIPFALIT